ncbi:MAG: ATP-grasp domain-containing protein [Ruminococcus sp.]|nr:ATP-grasp domain-containing protein [Ruminococcus sp.]
MRKKLMILGASILQLPAIIKAKELGLGVVAVDMDENAAGFSVKGIEKEVISTIDTPRVIEAAKRHRIDGIMTLASDLPMRTVAAVCKEMGLVGIDEATAHRATNKAAMRECLAAAGVAVPEFFAVRSEKELLEKVGRFGCAVIVKPADNSGSRGITVIPDPKDTQVALKAFRYSMGFSRSGTVVIEECMTGPEVSVETMSIDGVCHVIQITDKITTGAPHFVEMGHSQPTRLPRETAALIEKTAAAAVRAVGIMNGPSHTEIIVTREGPKIVELGARLGGDCITTHLTPLSTGVDMVECCIRAALGQTPDITRHKNAGSAIRYFDVCNGTIKRISGLDEAKSVPGVTHIEIVHDEGERIGEILSSSDRAGFIIAGGKDAQTAAAACEKAVSCVRFTIE